MRIVQRSIFFYCLVVRVSICTAHKFDLITFKLIKPLHPSRLLIDRHASALVNELSIFWTRLDLLLAFRNPVLAVTAVDCFDIFHVSIP